MPHVIVSADLPAQILPDFLARIGVATDQVRRQHCGLGKGGERPDPVGHVLAARAIRRLDADRPALEGQPASLLRHQIADAGGAMGRQAQALQLKAEAGKLDADNAGRHCSLL